MKSLLLCFILIGTAIRADAQLVAIREMKTPVEGVCDNSKVYAALIFEGQEEQKCSMSKAEIEELLNRNVTFLQKNPKYKLKKHESVSTLVNCKGELVAVELDTKSPEFNKQVCDVFRTMGAKWSSGLLNGTPVDSDKLWGITIKKGRIVLT